jgi:hypothetical protein
VTLDAEMVEALRAHRARAEQRAALAGTKLAGDGYVFSPAIDSSTMTNADTITQSYGRLARREHINTHGSKSETSTAS